MPDDSRIQHESPAGEIKLIAPNVEFFMFDSEAPPPEPASPTVRGILPSTAVQRCSPVTDASGFGWYIFPPVDFALRCDGQAVEFTRLADNEPVGWQSLDGARPLALSEESRALQRAPAKFREDFGIFDSVGGRFFFIDADPRQGNTCEITPALTARTSPGWSLLIRGPANWPLSRHHQILEGVLDTEWYGAKLVIIVRLLEVNQVVRFYREFPMAVAQPVPRVAVEASRRSAGQVVQGIENFPDEIWQRYADNRRRRVNGKGKGTYRAEQRRRQARPGRSAPSDGDAT